MRKSLIPAPLCVYNFFFPVSPHATPTDVINAALCDDQKRKMAHIKRLTAEVKKLKNFISKRKQTYKRKRKESGAPTRALSAYNIFVQERFKRLSKENEVALKSADTDAQMKRVPPASLVASTGKQWKELSGEEKQYYEDKYVYNIAYFSFPNIFSHCSVFNQSGLLGTSCQSYRVLVNVMYFSFMSYFILKSQSRG